MKRNKLYETHLFIDLYFRRPKRGLVMEQRSRGDKQKLFEAYGLFSGCHEIATKILEILSQNAHKKEESTIKINNSFLIDSVKVYMVDFNSGEMGFLPDESTVNSQGKYEPLTIEVDYSALYDKEDALILLMHELTHAYQNIEIIKKGKGEDLGTLGEKSKYFQNLQAATYSKYIKRLKETLYYFNRFEKGAYIAQLQAEVKAHGLFHSIREVCNFMEQTLTFKNYQTIYKWAKEFEDINDKETQNELLQYLKENSAFNFTTYNQFVKWLRNETFKTDKKFRTVIPKIAAENARVSKGMKTPNTKQLEGN